MLSVSAVRPLDVWDRFNIQPGGVSSVGGTLTQTRLRRSCPEQAPKFVNNISFGSNVVDGNNDAMYRVSAGPRVFDSAWERKSHRIERGWKIEDLRAIDKSVQPLMGDLPQFDWQNKIATAYKVASPTFAITPGGYNPKPGMVSRGPQPQRLLAGEPPIGYGTAQQGKYLGLAPTAGVGQGLFNPGGYLNQYGLT